MKILLVLLVLFVISTISFVNSSSQESDGGSKEDSSDSGVTQYIYTKYYETTDKTCSNNEISTSYDLSGYCNYGNMMSCNKNGSVNFKLFNETDCTGAILEDFSLEPDTCSGASQGVMLQCVEDIILPTANSFISIQALNQSCDWKDSAFSVSIRFTDTCVYAPQNAVILSCNQTTLTEVSYSSPTSCTGDAVHTSNFVINQCAEGEWGASFTYICN